MKKNILLTGASGYVGAMLADQLLRDKNVEYIIAIDKEKPDELLSEVIEKNPGKIFFIQENLGNKSWIKEVDSIQEKNNFKINSVIHTAWQIREMYGNKEKQWKWNIDGSNNVFDYVFENNIPKLVHFSTVASYGAYPDNKIDYKFKESDKFRETDYLYAEEKRIAEVYLEDKYNDAKKNGYKGQVVIIRPAAITGPRGRLGRIRFGLQSALSGGLDKEKSLAYKIVGKMTKFTPVTEKWLRQFVHEDDIVNLAMLSAMSDMPKDYEPFNVCPPGESVLGPDMAKAVNKKPIKLNPQMIRFVFFWMWHLTRGKIPTSKGGWKSYSYPIAVDGNRIAEVFNYKYTMGCKDAFVKNEGRYASRYVK